MAIRYELHIWTKNADLAVADRIIIVPVDNDDDAADAWELVEIKRKFEGARS